jgi:hypothetical protein
MEELNKPEFFYECSACMFCTAGVDQGSATPIAISPDHHGYGYTVWTPPADAIGTNGPPWPETIHGYKSWGDPSAVAMSIPTRLIGDEPYGRFDIGCSVHGTDYLTSKATTHCVNDFSDKRLHCNTVYKTELNQRNKDMSVVVGSFGRICGEGILPGMNGWGDFVVNKREYTCALVETVNDLTTCTVCQDGFEARNQSNGKGGCVRTGNLVEGDMAPIRIFPGLWQHHRFAQFYPTFH